MYETEKPVVESVPDEISGTLIEAMLRIFDPTTSEIYVEGRA